MTSLPTLKGRPGILRVSLAALALSLTCSVPLTAATTAPKPVSITKPEFPATLRKNGKEGRAVVKIRIEADGSVSDVAVKSADEPAFGEAAAAAVKTWKFEPATRDGQAVPISVEMPVVFSLSVEEKLNLAFKREVFTKFDEPFVEAKVLKERPKLKKPVKPNYPKSLTGSGQSADIRVEYFINTKGAVIIPSMPKSDAPVELQLAAVTTVARYDYEPVKHEGKPVNVRMVATIKLRDPSKEKS